MISVFDGHVLFWNCNQFKKTFMTALLRFPKCLFNSGYSQLEVISTTISRFYNNKICWVLASIERVDELATIDDNCGATVTIVKNKISMDIPFTLS
jgi:hypothetical protein